MKTADLRMVKDLLRYIIVYCILIVVLDRIDYITVNQTAAVGGLVLFIIIDKIAHKILDSKIK